MTNDIRKAQRLTLGGKPFLSASSGQLRQIGPPKGLRLRSGQGVAGVSSSLERTGAKGVAPLTSLRAAAANPDADPMTHITYLASAELRGRGSRWWIGWTVDRKRYRAYPHPRSFPR
jgi:hypothetical protein